MQPANDNRWGPERRGVPRQRVASKGRIVNLGASLSYDCVMRDLSPAGAHLRLLGAELVPSELFLIDVHNARAHEGRLAWSRADRVGVAFQRSHDLAPGAPGLAGLRHLWSELAPRAWRVGG